VLKIRRLGWLLTALPVLALGAAPFWFGIEAEKRHAQWTLALQEEHGFKASAMVYERGWLTSTASYTLALPNLPLQMKIVHTIQHGPLVLDRVLANPASLLEPVQAVVHSEMTLALAGVPAKDSPLTGLPPLTADSVIGIRGAGVSTIAMAPMKKTLADGASVEFKGVDGRIDFDTQWNAVRSDIVLPGLVLKDAQKTLTVGRMTANADLRAGSNGYFLGTVSMSMEQAALPTLGASLAGVRLTTTTRETGKLLNTSARYELREFKLGDAVYGPASVALELRKLDAATLMKLQKTLNAAQKPGAPPQQAALMAMGHLLNLAGTLAKSAPELEITQFSVRMPAGEVRGRAKFVLDGTKMDVAANPMLLVNAFGGDGELTMAAGVIDALARQQAQMEFEQLKASGQLDATEIARLTPQKVALILDQALPARARALAARLQLVRQGTDYQIKASIRQGRLLVNGQPMQVPIGPRL
jgi:uncharacterized protein YdgA (DUF945 family)